VRQIIRQATRIVNLTDAEAMEAALVENLIRADELFRLRLVSKTQCCRPTCA
jgi:hypothetical protein